MEVENESQVNFRERLEDIIGGDSLDFDSWALLISEIEKTHAENIDIISLIYDSFLSKFPLCHWYWRKYAYHKARLCTIAEAVEIFEQAIVSATFSVGLWLDYCTFSETFFKDPSDIRRIYERGISFVGKDYFCHALWDKYMQFEFSQQHWSILPQVYIQKLKFPTKKLHFYYDNFQKFVTILEEEIRCQNNNSIEVDPEDLLEVAVKLSKDDISRVIKDLQDNSDGSRRSRALHKYKTIGDQLYQRALQLDEKIKTFETKIRRRYFQVTPLDDDELSNWHQYLDFVEKQEDFDWALRLYERCLISCAKYPEFWMRYVEFMETRRGRPLAIFALERATQIFLKDVPEFHLFSARFREEIGDANGARDAYLCCKTDSDAFFTENVVRQANMEKRLGNMVAASKIYEKALKTAGDQQKVHLLPSLYIHFSRLKYMITGSVDAARDVIVDGIQKVPYCRLLFEELMKFAMTHEGSKQVSVIDSLVAKAISPGSDASGGFDTKDKVDISCLFLEFVDLCGTLNDIKKAWDRHVKLFPQFIRPSSSYNGPARGDSLMNEIKEQRETKLCTLLKQLSEDQESCQDTQLPVQEQSLNTDNHMQQNQVSAEQSLPDGEEIDLHKSMLQSPRITDQASDCIAGLIESNHDLVLDSGDDASGVMESTLDPVQHHKEVANEPTESTHGFDHQHKENAPGTSESTCDVGQQSTPNSEPLQDLSRSLENCQVHDDKLKQDLMMDSFENPSLNSQEKETQELNHIVLDENPVTEVISTSKESIPVDSLNVKPDTTDSLKTATASPFAEGRNESHAKRSDGISSSGSLENHTSAGAYPNSSGSPSPSENSHRLDHSIKNSRGGTARFYEHSHDRLHKQPKSASLQRHATAEIGPELLPSRGSSQQVPVLENCSPKQVQYQSGTPQENIPNNYVWPANNLPQQSPLSTSQSQISVPPVPHPPPNTLQHTIQSSQQVGEMPHDQVTSQMLQYQQQQILIQQQYQQQMLQIQQQYYYSQHQYQHQPAYQQQQHLHPQQQQYLQQQHFQSPSYYSQQPFSYLQQAQVQQVQQQTPQMQLQKNHQSEELAHQMNQPGYQQYADQGYQQYMQQYQLQQQGYYQMPQQQHSEGYRHMEQEEEEAQPTQQLQDADLS